MNCPRCGAGQGDSSKSDGAVCQACGEPLKKETAPSRGGFFRFSALFQRKRERGGYLTPCLGLSHEPRAKPALRQEPRVEPFYGDEEYIPAPEDDLPSGVVPFSSTALDLWDLEDDPSTPDSPDSAADSQGVNSDEQEEEELGSGSDMIEIEPQRPWVVPSENPFSRNRQSSYPERSTRCFDCGATLQYSDKTAAVSCSRCSATVSLEDVEIRDHRREPVKTRGNLTIRRNASLAAPEIACETLRVHGKITGRIDCHGDAFFRSSGKVVGSFHCRHLFVHSDSDLTFVPGIRAETAEIHGRVAGDLICEGTVRISRTGTVVGDCIAPAIHLESGGVLSGQMQIAKPDRELEEDYDRKAEVARSEFLMRGIEEFEASARRVETDVSEELQDVETQEPKEAVDEAKS